MFQTIYWHAPLWQLLVLFLINFSLIGWLLIQVVRPSNLGRAFAQIHPILNHQPLFFYSRLQGVIPLNQGAEAITTALSATPQKMVHNVLIDALSEAYTEGRTIQHTDWPTAGQSLVVMPFFQSAGKIEGAFAIVTQEVLEEVPRQRAKFSEKIITDTTGLTNVERTNVDWISMGAALCVHHAKPMIQIQPDTSVSNSQINGTDVTRPWQERSLNQAEETLLRHLLKHQGETQTAEVLFCKIWTDIEIDEIGLRSELRERLRRVIYTVRQKVEPDPRNPQFICTVHGVGYVLYGE